MNLQLDFSFYSWDLIRNFVLKGLYFSLLLTIVATLGGVAVRHPAGPHAPVGPPMAGPAGRPLRQRHAQHPAGDGDPVVLPAGAGRDRPAHRRRALGGHHLRRLRGGLLQRDHACRHPVHPARPGLRRPGPGHALRPEHAPGGAAAGLAQHAAGAADADHHPVPGHLAGLRHRRLRHAQGLRNRRQELRPSDRGLPGGGRASISSSATRCPWPSSACTSASPSPLR